MWGIILESTAPVLVFTDLSILEKKELILKGISEKLISRIIVFYRIWWFVIFGMALSVCSISIYAVYKKWDTSPVIVTFATRGTPMYSIPFPAVTVCPESKSIQNLFNFTRILQKKEDRIGLSDLE